MHIAKLKIMKGAEYSNENDSEDTQKQNLCNSQRLLDDEIAKGINSWNSKHTKDYVKYDGHDIEPDTVAYQNIALSL